MKKTFTLFLAAATLLCACQKQNPSTANQESEAEIIFKVGACIDNNTTRTAFVPEGNKVIWLTGDKIGLKYTKVTGQSAKNDNLQLILDKGENTGVGNFSGKLTTKTNAFPNGNVLVFYYPYMSAVAKTGTVTDKDNIVLGGSFPKIQLNNNIQFDPNLMYAIATDVKVIPTADPLDTLYNTTSIEVKMKNVMSVIDFTFMGEGKLKRVYVTDLNTAASAMTGDYEVNIINGEFAGFKTLPKGTEEYSRTISCEFQKAVDLTATGVHVYMTVMPRTYSAGIKVGLEMEDGKFMTKTISTEFTTESNKVYVAPALTFVDQSGEGKGFFENTVYTYKTFTDDRDDEVYRYATLADGRDWMLENLRHCPKDYTPSSLNSAIDNGVWYPVLINATGTGVAFNTTPTAVEKFGYLYNISVALGQDAEYIYEMQKAVVKDSSMTAAEALAELKAIDSTGICPAGWYIPSEAEYKNLYSQSGSNISGLGVQGFNLKDFGYFNVANFSKDKTGKFTDPTTGTPSGWTAPKINMTYLILSTPYSYAQYKGVMTNITNNTAATANLNARSGAAVRCIKAKED